MNTALSAVAVPGDLRRLMARAERGELEVRLAGLQEGLDRLYGGIQQLLWGLVAGTAGVVAFVADGRAQPRVVQAALGVAGIGVLLLLATLWRHRRRR